MNSFLSSCAVCGAFLLCVVYAAQGCVDGSGTCEQTQVNSAALQSIPCAAAADCPDLGLECVVPECVSAANPEGGLCRYHNAAEPIGLPPAIYEATYSCRSWCAKNTAGGGEGGAGGAGGGVGGALPASGGSSSGGGGPNIVCDDGNECTLDYALGNACTYVEDTSYPPCLGGTGLCFKGECCVAGCVDLSAQACVSACPPGKVCGTLGVCVQP